MNKYKWIIILINLVLLLVFFNHLIVKNEAILSEGKLVLLELAPVDPRSLIQGDYMNLRYRISAGERNKINLKRGYFVVQLQPNGIANKVRLQQDKIPLNDNEYIIQYTLGKRSINIGAESFFFQEGQAGKFAKAKYGGIKIDKEGSSLLIGLFDEQLKLIE